MEIDIITDKTNLSLKRRDVSIVVKSKSTPSRLEVKNKLAALLDSKPELIVVNRLNPEFGKQETVGTAGIYENVELLKNVALGHLAGRDKVPPLEEEPETESPPEGEGVAEDSGSAPEGEAVPAIEEETSAEQETVAKEEAKKESGLEASGEAE
ncbi:MAG: hypothetical protein SCH70_09465 [Candidatus Methanoperedens sp.]|nr:hypothetical protein [Candidatus Methanoperedens sp.]